MDEGVPYDEGTLVGDDGTGRRLPAGMADAAFASLATFLAGLSAVTLFGDVDRGVYALFFSAFGLGVVLPWNLILVPAEVNAVTFPVVDRMRRAPITLRFGLLASLVGSLAIVVAGVMSWSLTTPSIIVMLGGTAMVTTVLSPLQDHMRRLLHISEMSWRAATVSIVQFVAVVVSLGVMWLADAPVAVMPFGALAIANAVSLTTGLFLGDVWHRRRLPVRLTFWELAREGKWLLASAVVPSVAHFAVASIITALAGAAVLGYTEAARVVAQPVLVFATGLTAVLAPKVMRAAMEVNIHDAKHTRRLFLFLSVSAGVLYLLAASTDWFGNPMGYIVPAAYVVPGLVATMIASNLVTVATYLQSDELLGAQKAKELSLVGIVLSPILILVAFTAGTTGAFARPLGKIARGSVQIGWFQRMLNRHYANGVPIVEPETATESAPG